MTDPGPVCQLAPCSTDHCPITGGPCRRPWPWRRTPAAVFDLVNPDHDPTMYEPIPPEQRERPQGRRRRPYASAAAEAAPEPPRRRGQLTMPGL